MKTKRNLVALLVIVLLAGGILYRFKNQFIVAVVNGQPISRLTLIKELEKQAGKSTLDALITKTLILQEARKQNVTISDDEISQEVKRFEESLAKQGQDLNQLLSLQGKTQSELEEQIRIQKILEKIVGKDIEVADEEVEGYFEENKDSFPQEASAEEIKIDIKQYLEQQKLNAKIQSWVESLRENAQINYFLNSKSKKQ